MPPIPITAPTRAGELLQVDVADNIDLPTILQEYEEAYEYKYGRRPKLVRRQDTGSSRHGQAGRGCFPGATDAAGGLALLPSALASATGPAPAPVSGAMAARQRRQKGATAAAAAAAEAAGEAAARRGGSPAGPPARLQASSTAAPPRDATGDAHGGAAEVDDNDAGQRPAPDQSDGPGIAVQGQRVAASRGQQQLPGGSRSRPPAAGGHSSGSDGDVPGRHLETRLLKPLPVRCCCCCSSLCLLALAWVRQLPLSPAALAQGTASADPAHLASSEPPLPCWSTPAAVHARRAA
jgi:katanin p60 ATPase-containing subunit A1